MRKLILVFVIISMLLTVCGCNTGDDPVSDDTDINVTELSDVYFVDGKQVKFEPVGGASLSLDGTVSLIFSFSIPRDIYSFIYDNLEDVRLSGYYSEFDTGAPITTENGVFTEVVTLSGTEEDVRFGVVIGGISSECYLTDYVALLSLAFTDSDGERYTVSAKSTERCVHDVALYEYCDRSEEKTEEYSYPTGDGSFSPVEDLNTHRMILYSTLKLSLTSGGVSDMTVGEWYDSPYTLEWFDGILTVRLSSGNEIPEGLLKNLYVNGKNTYFEVYEGIIRVVVDN